MAWFNINMIRTFLDDSKFTSFSITKHYSCIAKSQRGQLSLKLYFLGTDRMGDYK